MSENLVRVPFESDAPGRATLLLAAAHELGYDANVVATDTSSPGAAFHAPKDVVDKAFGKSHSYGQAGAFAQTEQATEAAEVEAPSDLPDNTVKGELGTPPDQPPTGDQTAKAAKKAPAKKAAKRPAKKTAAKKAAAKKGS